MQLHLVGLALLDLRLLHLLVAGLGAEAAARDDVFVVAHHFLGAFLLFLVALGLGLVLASLLLLTAVLLRGLGFLCILLLGRGGLLLGLFLGLTLLEGVGDKAVLLLDVFSEDLGGAFLDHHGVADGHG